MWAGDVLDFFRKPVALHTFVLVQGHLRSSHVALKTPIIALLLRAGPSGVPGTRARLMTRRAKPPPPKPADAANPASGGCLYLVGTPIGNLEDITLRALRILKEVDQIACEDTRHTMKLLTHYDIHKPLVSYHEHNELTRAPELVVALEQGAKIALVSDAGMPLVSDPGHRLVTLCLRHHIPVVPIPGPSALLASLSASALPTQEFLIVAFFPSPSGERRRALERLRIECRTIILY